MPQKSVLDDDLQKRLLKTLMEHRKSIYDEQSGSFSGPSHTIWSTIAESLNHKISAKYAYCIVKLNRFDTWTALDLSLPNQEGNPSTNVNDKERSISFNITLSADEWSKIFNADQQVYRRKDGTSMWRNYSTLAPTIWTSVIHAHVYNETKVPCCIAYKRAKIYQMGKNFLDIIGKCTSCHSVFKAIMDSKPNKGSPATLECTYVGDFTECNESRKRRISGEKKKEFIDKLSKQNWSSSYVQKHEANELMDFGDPEPSHLPTTNALRILKHKFADEDHVHKDPVLAVCILKESMPYNAVIRDVGYDRFFLHYYSACEINVYRLYTKQNKVPRVVIDATGGVVQPITLLSGRKTHHIFLYQIGVMDYSKNIQFPVAHMLSERHDHDSISYWLSCWLKNDVAVPKLVVTDHSLALMMACAQAFTQYSSLTKYLHVCSEFILNPNTSIANLPTCMVRNDFNHVMHQLSSWPEMKSSSRRIKNFYLRALAMLISTEDFEDAKKLLDAIFSVALNETEGFDKEYGMPVPPENAKQFLKERIATHAEISDYEYEESVDDDLEESNEIRNEPVDDSSYTTSFYLQISRIYDTCVQKSKEIEGDHENAHFCPKLAERLKQYTRFYPCWGAIMNPFFGYGKTTESSATAESLFNEVKNQVFQHKKLPIRLDDFIATHVDFIMGNNKINFNKYSDTENNITEDEKQREQENETSEGNTVVNEEEGTRVLNKPEIEEGKKEIVENWRGQGTTEHKKLKKGTYLDKDPTILYTKDGSKSKVPIIGILKNGNVLSLKPISIGNRNYTFTNTCAFDSAVHAMCTSYVDSQTFANFINENSSSLLFFELIKNMVRDGVTSQAYVKRGRILEELFRENLVESDLLQQLIMVNCASTIFYVTDKLFLNFPSYTTVSRCDDCTNVTNEIGKPTITIDFDSCKAENLDTLIQAYFARTAKIVCPSCGSSSAEKFDSPNQHLLIEPWLIKKTEQALAQRWREPFNVTLNEIPRNLHIHDKMFTLRGVISFVSPASKSSNAIGHYLTYSWRDQNSKFEKYDDLDSKFSNVRSRITVNCHLFVYSV